MVEHIIYKFIYLFCLIDLLCRFGGNIIIDCNVKEVIASSLSSLNCVKPCLPKICGLFSIRLIGSAMFG